LTPEFSPNDSEPPASRRRSSARRPYGERVVFARGERKVAGWALNISRGGLRAILEEAVTLGTCFQITLGDEETKRAGRVVWIREQPDGAIVGVAFLDAPPDAVHPAPPPADECPPSEPCSSKG
jgi:hypothetical protein